MSDTKTSSPAFPYHGPDSGKTGMTLRDYFAAKAMVAIITVRGEHITPEFVASLSYTMADGMLRARK